MANVSGRAAKGTLGKNQKEAYVANASGEVLSIPATGRATVRQESQRRVETES
ncbi:hypothetical protein [Labrys miyagiensis]|uniref:hypothetical protein n=1 Tax=Labrys miyagiensis TaxID=346912 RepID=UPI0024E12838|nr:hypothetical protein [Labrys miyagiensis]